MTTINYIGLFVDVCIIYWMIKDARTITKLEAENKDLSARLNIQGRRMMEIDDQITGEKI